MISPLPINLGRKRVTTRRGNHPKRVMGPRGVPGPIIKKIQEVFLEATKKPEHMDKMDKAGLAVKPIMGEEYLKYFRNLQERCKALVDAARKAR